MCSFSLGRLNKRGIPLIFTMAFKHDTLTEGLEPDLVRFIYSAANLHKVRKVVFKILKGQSC